MQTFVTIWWLKNPSKLVALISVGMLWLFVIVFVAVEFAVNTNPPDSYYATPTPVCYKILPCRSIVTFIHGSIGVGLVSVSVGNGLRASTSGFG